MSNLLHSWGGFAVGFAAALLIAAPRAARGLGRRPAWLFALAFPFLAAGAHGQSPTANQSLLDRCRDQNPDIRIAACTALIKSGDARTEDLAIAFNGRGIGYTKKGDYDHAIADFNQAIRLKPDTAYILDNRGSAYYQDGQFDRAIQDYDQAIMLKAHYADAFVHRGDAYRAKGQYDRAIQDYDQAILHKAHDADAYGSRGDAYENLGQNDRAVEDYSEAIRLKPDDADLLANRCRARAVLEQFQDALADCSKSLSLRPGDTATLNRRGFLYLKMGQYAAAIADFDAALTHDQKLASSLKGRSLAERAQGHTAKAEDDIALAKEIEVYGKSVVLVRSEGVADQMRTFLNNLPFRVIRDCADCPEMLVIPDGTFRIGSPVGEEGRSDAEGPRHSVTVRSFALAKYDVTFAEFDACVAAGGCNSRRPDDQDWGRGNRPVVDVSWNEAQSYVSWLSTKSGKPYRLPSEAEWESAARAGTATTYYWGSDTGAGNAVCNGCGSEWDNTQTAPVGSLAANPWGFYDMLGNVWQWTADCYHENYNGAPDDGAAWTAGDCSTHVLRGGSFSTYPFELRSALRNRSAPDGRYRDVGFRLARTLDQAEAARGQ